MAIEETGWPVKDAEGYCEGCRAETCRVNGCFAERDAIDVECPACGAPAGYPCNAPAEGLAAVGFCGDRVDAAPFDDERRPVAAPSAPEGRDA